MTCQKRAQGKTWKEWKKPHDPTCPQSQHYNNGLGKSQSTLQFERFARKNIATNTKKLDDKEKGGNGTTTKSAAKDFFAPGRSRRCR